MRSGGGRGRPRPAEELDLFGEDAAPPSRAYDRRRATRPESTTRTVCEPVVPGSDQGTALTVAALVRVARDLLEGAFTPLWVRGEVSDFKAHRNGHWYFCLRDDMAQLRCVVWSREQRRIPAPPADGMQVVAFGQPTVYPARGEIQFTATAIEAVGEGLRRRALELAYARLAGEGLLAVARKRPIPRYPRCVAIVTSPDGAALRDVVAVIRRRCPSVHIVVASAKVQGDGAPGEIAAAIERVSRWGGADTVIVGRGGGAREDLWAFNDERVARALAASAVPTISAVGHEIDVSLCDLVADLRAPTPSAAAEAAVPVLSELRARTASLNAALHQALVQRAQYARTGLARATRAIGIAGERLAERKGSALATASARLQARSPLATLARGFAIARDHSGTTLASVSGFAPGMPFELLLRDGTVPALVRDGATQASPSSNVV